MSDREPVESGGGVAAAIRAELEQGLHLVPGHMRAAITGYVLHRRPVGHFLTALLANDLMAAFARADEANAAAMQRWCRFLYNFTPSPCWGSPEKVRAWLGGNPA